MRYRSIRYIEQAVAQWKGKFTFEESTLKTKWGMRNYSKAPGSPHAMIHGVPIYNPSPEEAARIAKRNAWIAVGLVAVSGGAYVSSRYRFSPTKIKLPREEHLINWSGTHDCSVESFYEPDTIEELEDVVQQAHNKGEKLRCIGSGLSPNGIAFENSGMVSLGLLDKIIDVDPSAGTVRVQAGARVQDVADALRPYGLTLPNYASIREQTIGGFTQVSAHGTGARIPPVDEMVIGMKLVTPALGTLHLSDEGDDADLFRLARVGLGCLGIVSELTLKCVPAHKLVERTFVSSPAEIRQNHKNWLKQNKHLRYMWIPGADAVVVVQCNEASGEDLEVAEAESLRPSYSLDQQLDPLRKLLKDKIRQRSSKSKESSEISDEEILEMSATQLRDALLAEAPLDPKWIHKVNIAEAEYWKKSSGVRVGWSDQILGFDCGGQQWVLEVAFPMGNIEVPNDNDIDYMMDTLSEIKRNKIPAPAPIEQRWSSGSRSPMSPVAGAPNSLHSWVGIIMYLPEEENLRNQVTTSFSRYAHLMQQSVMKKYNAIEHWAKIEVPETEDDIKEKRAQLRARYPLEDFVDARKRLDPKNILGNDLVDKLLSG